MMGRTMIELNARYDGKVIVPDTPLDLPANVRVRISVEPIDPRPQTEAPYPKTDFSKWLGLGLREPQNPNPRFLDDDSLWEGSVGDTLINDPRKNRRR
jgi:hypothetical protein